MSATGTVTGTVRDAGTGLPIPNAWVFIESVAVSTDAEGVYTIPDLAPGDEDIYGVKTGYAVYAGSVTILVGEIVTKNFSVVAYTLTTQMLVPGDGNMHAQRNTAAVFQITINAYDGYVYFVEDDITVKYFPYTGVVPGVIGWVTILASGSFAEGWSGSSMVVSDDGSYVTITCVPDEPFISSMRYLWDVYSCIEEGRPS